MNILFPRPSPAHYEYNTFPDLYFLPKTNATQSDIPIFYIPWPDSNLLLVYSHPNAADIGSMYTTFKYYQKFWKVNIILWEYPGYGCNFGNPSEASINANLVEVIRFAKIDLKFSLNKIIFYGQSIGGGPATWMVSNLNRQKVRTGGLILQCTFTSVKDAAASLVGSWAASLVDDYWHNDIALGHVSDGLLIIHGRNDRIVPWQHAQTNFNKSKSKNKKFHLSEEASHNEWEPFTDIIYPIEEFINKMHRPNGTPPDSIQTTTLNSNLTNSTNNQNNNAEESKSKESTNNNNNPSKEEKEKGVVDRSMVVIPEIYKKIPQAVIEDYNKRIPKPQTSSNQGDQNNNDGNFNSNDKDKNLSEPNIQDRGGNSTWGCFNMCFAKRDKIDD